MFNIVPFVRRSSGIQRNNDLFDIEGIFENFVNDRFFPALYKNSSQLKVDIKENENEYILEAELPGIKKEEVNLQIDDDRLTNLSRKMSKQMRKRTIISVEREAIVL